MSPSFAHLSTGRTKHIHHQHPERFFPSPASAIRMAFLQKDTEQCSQLTSKHVKRYARNTIEWKSNQKTGGAEWYVKVSATVLT